MSDQFLRTELVLGKKALEKLACSKVAVFGLGGVGGYVAEALARSGIGALDLIDNDVVSITNLNRQLLATYSSLGKYKVDVAKERIKDINKNCAVQTYKTFYLPENSGQFDFKSYDYVVDAIDTVASKIDLVLKANEAEVPIISAMGAGNKLCPEKFEVADIYETSVCPLAHVMRKELRKKGILSLKVVYSKENPVRTPLLKDEKSGKRIAGSTAFVPPVVGLIMASQIVRDLTTDVRDFEAVSE